MTTLVSCYYKIKSKHSPDEYRSWIAHLFQSLNDDVNMILFTSSDQADWLRQCADRYRLQRLIIVIKEFSDLPIFQDFPMTVWEHQYSLDKWKNSGRTKECYILWNSKFLFLKEAIEMNIFNTRYFVWNDIGSLRGSIDLSNYPNGISDDKLDITLLVSYSENKEYFQNEVHLSGSLFAGDKDTLLKLSRFYYQYLQEYIDNDYFVGCDQQILSTLVQRHKDKVNFVVPRGHTIDPWFYMYKHLSASNHQPSSQDQESN